jgi:hypothetical protein
MVFVYVCFYLISPLRNICIRFLHSFLGLECHAQCITQRGVKFGLFTPNPRVEGVMVSAPPEIAYPYNHVVAPGSPEAQLVEVLKTPRSWVD